MYFFFFALRPTSTVVEGYFCAFIRMAGIVRGSVGGVPASCITNHSFFPLHELN